MHLTNYAINKENPEFQKNQEGDNDSTGHKRSLTFAWKYIDSLGFDSKVVIQNVKDIILKTLISVQPMLAHTYRSCQPDDTDNSMCFEVLGFDIFLDHKLKPWVLEVNHTPSFTTDSPLDFKIKKNLISDTCKLLNLSYYKKMKFKREKTQEFTKRAMGKVRVTREEKDALRLKRD